MSDRQLYGIGIVFGGEVDDSIEKSADSVKKVIDGLVRATNAMGGASVDTARKMQENTRAVEKNAQAVDENARQGSLWARGARTVVTWLRGMGTSASQSIRPLDNLRGAMTALNTVNLSAIRDRLESLTDQVTQGLDVQSTSLESFGAQFGQTYRQATAGLGPYRAAVDRVRGQISGLSFDLGIGAEGMISYAANISRAGHSLEDFGLTMRAVAGLEQAGILAGAELSAYLTDLANSYGLGAEGAMRLTNRMVALGESFGYGADMLRQMPAVMAAISPVAAELGWAGDQASSAAESIARLAMANVSLGGTPQQAFESAVATFTQLGEARTGLQRLLSGMEGEFPQLAQQLGIASGDIGNAFDTMMQNPVEFAARVRQMYDDATDPQQQARLRQVMQSLGPSFSWLVQGGERTATALRAAQGPIGDFTNAVQNLGTSGASSARTFAESMDLLRERFQTQVNGMVRSMPGYENFERRVLQRQRRAYTNLAARIRTFVGGDGLFAQLGRVALAAHRGGIGGLGLAIEQELGARFPTLRGHLETVIPLLGEFGDAAFDAAGQVLPMMGALGSMGIRLPRFGAALGFLLNPLTLVVAGIAYLAIRGDEAQKDLARLEARLTTFTTRLADLSGVFLEWARRIDFKKIGRDVIDAILGAFGIVRTEGQSQLAQNLTKIFRNVFAAVSEVVRGLAQGLWGRVVEWVTEPVGLWPRIRRGAAVFAVAFGSLLLTPLRGVMLRGVMGLGRWLGPQMLRGIGAAFRGLRGLPAMFRGLRGAIGMAGGIRALTGPVLRSALRGIPYVGTILGVLFDLPDIISSFRTGGVGVGIRRILHSIANGFLLGIPDLLRQLTGFDFIERLFDGLIEQANLQRIWRRFASGDVLGGLGEALFGVLNMALGGIPNTLRRVFARLGGRDVFGDWFSSIANTIRMVWGALVRVFEQVRQVWDQVAQPLFSAFQITLQTMSGLIGDVWSALGLDSLEFFNTIRDFANTVLLGELGPWFEEVWTRAKVVAQDFVNWLSTDGTQAIVRGLMTGIDWVFRLMTAIANTRAMWRWFVESVQAGARLAGESLRIAVVAPLYAMQGTLLEITNAIQGSFDNLRVGIGEIIQYLLTSLRDMYANMLGPIGTAMASGLDPTIARVTENLSTMRRDNEREAQQREARASRIRNEAAREMARFEAERGSAVGIWTAGPGMYGQEARDIEQRRREALAAVAGVATPGGRRERERERLAQRLAGIHGLTPAEREQVMAAAQAGGRPLDVDAAARRAQAAVQMPPGRRRQAALAAIGEPSPPPAAPRSRRTRIPVPAAAPSPPAATPAGAPSGTIEIGGFSGSAIHQLNGLRLQMSGGIPGSSQ